MSGPPPPPKRKNRQPTSSFGGAGHNVARSLNSKNWKNISENDYQHQKVSKLCLINELPDSVIGEGVEIHGELQFDRLLRVDGKFQGKLISKGDLIVGHRGCIVGDITTITRMVVDGGSITGNITVEELVLRGKSVVQGDISCKAIEIIGQDVSILGRANVHPLAPELVDADDNIISVIPSKPKRAQKQFPPPIVPTPIVVRNNAPSNDASSSTLYGYNSQLPPVTIVPRNDALTSEDPEVVSVETARLEHLATKSRRQNPLQLNSSQDGDAADRASGSSVSAPEADQRQSTRSAVPSVELAMEDEEEEMTVNTGISKNPQIFLPPSAEQRAAQLELDNLAEGSTSVVDAESEGPVAGPTLEKNVPEESVALGSLDAAQREAASAPETINATESAAPEVNIAAPEVTGNEAVHSVVDEAVAHSLEGGQQEGLTAEAQEVISDVNDNNSSAVAAATGPWGNDESVELLVGGVQKDAEEVGSSTAAVTPHFVEPGEVQIAAESPPLPSLKDLASSFADLAESISSGATAADGSAGDA